MLLLNPGPVSLSERVRQSLLRPDLCHRESEFFDLQDEVRSRLLSTYELDAALWNAVLMTASGTAAVESMVAALVPPDGRLLIVENGVYGERIAQICARYGIAHERMVGDWMQAPERAAIEQRLASQGASRAFSHVALVHHETTTGRLNDLRSLLDLCGQYGARLLVDGVSSFGAEAIDFADAALAAVAATANKCLHGVPGAAFVLARRSDLQGAVSRTYYLDLGRLARLQDERNTPFTPAVHAYYALAEALREYAEQGGRSARYQRYAAFAEQVRSGFADLGIACAIPPAESSVVLRAYRLPDGISYLRLHDALKRDGFVIYAGQGNLSNSLFRISTMGNLNAGDIDRLLQCFERLLR
ncbi:MAG TPA: 2-aminoethylphosphonate aminotransferase [Steroidobacteraceae bacterium]|jgi:2-aminoethylphosphonate-pyruvate transaminase|nr:2-aminoethylphosphonate aminotransferase [Steroidobacteraceae bacterium]